jgi:hypothetical protein
MLLLRLLLLTASSSMTAAAAFHLTSITITRHVFSSFSSALLQSLTSSATALTKQLHLYDLLTRTKTPLVPIDNSNNNKVSMYTCGPTVYNSAHVGNFRAFLIYDILKRTLLYLGYAVDHNAICPTWMIKSLKGATPSKFPWSNEQPNIPMPSLMIWMH